MTATNHAATGGLIAVLVANPVLAMPLAFMSHFLLDALPHFGNHPKADINSRAFKIILISDIALMLIGVTVMTFLFSHIWWLVALAAGLAISPDLMWFPYFLAVQRGEKRNTGVIARFHKKIQWAEIPSGWFIEVIYFVAISGFLVHLAVN